MELSKEVKPAKVYPLWQRILFFILGLIMIPAFIYLVGLALGFIWRIGTAGYNVGYF